MRRAARAASAAIETDAANARKELMSLRAAAAERERAIRDLDEEKAAAEAKAF